MRRRPARILPARRRARSAGGARRSWRPQGTRCPCSSRRSQSPRRAHGPGRQAPGLAHHAKPSGRVALEQRRESERGANRALPTRTGSGIIWNRFFCCVVLLLHGAKPIRTRAPCRTGISSSRVSVMRRGGRPDLTGEVCDPLQRESSATLSPAVPEQGVCSRRALLRRLGRIRGPQKAKGAASFSMQPLFRRAAHSAFSNSASGA